MFRHPSCRHELGQRLYDVTGAYVSVGSYGQTLPGVFVHDGKQSHSSTVLSSEHDEVIGPYMVGSLGTQAYAGAIIQPEPPSPGLLPGHLQPFPSPYPLHPLVVDMPTTLSEQGSYPSVAVSAEPTGQAHDLPGECGLLLGGSWHVALRGARLTQHPAYPSLRHGQQLLHSLHTLAAADRAQKFPRAASFSI